MRAIWALLAATVAAAAADSRVLYPERFPGIDLVVYRSGRAAEYDWVVRPGADPSAIRMKFRAATVDSNGDLIAVTPVGVARHTKPRTYQEADGLRRIIASEFVVGADGAVGFRVGKYDRRLPLVIDPQVEWVTAFGWLYRYDVGTLHPRLGDAISDMAVDRDGNLWVTGMAYFSAFPKVNAFQSECPGDHCTFVAKLSADGTKILFSSYLAAPAEPLPWPFINRTPYFPSAIACDPEGNVYVTGAAGVLRSPSANDVFLLKLDTNGTIKAKMVFGGSGDDVGTSLAVGPDGFLYVAGKTEAADFPVTVGAYRIAGGASRIFAVKVDAKLLAGDTAFAHAAVYSALPGNSSWSVNSGRRPLVGADLAGNAWVGITAECPNLGPVKPDKCGESYDTLAALLQLNRTGVALIRATNPFGVIGTDLVGMAVSAAGEVYLAGSTTASSFPVSKGALRTASSAKGPTRYVAKLRSGEVEWATFVTDVSDTSSGISGGALGVDSAGNVYVGGFAAAAEIPALGALQSKAALADSGYLTAIRPDGRGLIWSTPLGTSGPFLVVPGAQGAVYAAGTVNPGLTIANINDTAAPYGNQTISIAKITPGGAPALIAGLANAASYQPGIPLAGGLASLWADRPVEPEGLAILVGGAPAFVTGVAGRQVNFQVPYEGSGAAAPGGRYAVELRQAGLSSFALMPPTGPGIFTLEDGSAAITHGSDASLVTRSAPASPGEVVVVYMTGLGYAGPQRLGVAPAGPAQMTGLCFQPTANAGEVLYAGVTPGTVGLYQMNIRLRSDLPPGDFRLVVTRNDCPSPNAATPYERITPVRRESNAVVLSVR